MIIHNVPGALPSQNQQQQPARATIIGRAIVDERLGRCLGCHSSNKRRVAQGTSSRIPRYWVCSIDCLKHACTTRSGDFSEAAIRYHELSYVAEIDEDDRAMMLSAAVTAAILSPAGTSASEDAGYADADERHPALPQYTILSKVFLDRVISAQTRLRVSRSCFRHTRLPACAVVCARSSQLLHHDDGGQGHATRTIDGAGQSDDRAQRAKCVEAVRQHHASRAWGIGRPESRRSGGHCTQDDHARTTQRLDRQVGSVSTSQTGARGGGVLFFVDQDRRGEGETTAGGLEATKVESSGGEGGGVQRGVGEDGTTGGGAGSGDVDTKWTRRWTIRSRR